MANDKVSGTDVLDVAAGGGDRVPANWPCPLCSRETNEHRKDGAPEDVLWRICTGPLCRHEYVSDQRSVLPGPGDH